MRTPVEWLHERGWEANEGLRQWEDVKQSSSHREVGFGLAMKKGCYVNTILQGGRRREETSH